MATIKNKALRLCVKDLTFLLAVLAIVQAIVYLSNHESYVIWSNPISTLIWHAMLYTFFLIVAFVFVDTLLTTFHKKEDRHKPQPKIDKVEINIAEKGTVHQVSTGSNATLTVEHE